MTLYVFEGPNGSGMSTIIKDYIEYYGLTDIEYICPDIYASKLFSDIPNVYERYAKAMDFASYKRERLLNEGRSMIMETVLSRSDKPDFILKAKGLGYRIISIFVGTENADINYARVKKRVSEGGHDVPEDKLRARFTKSMDNLPLLADCSDELYVYDNSGTGPKLAMSIVDSEMFVTAECTDWVKRILL